MGHELGIDPWIDRNADISIGQCCKRTKARSAVLICDRGNGDQHWYKLNGTSRLACHKKYGHHTLAAMFILPHKKCLHKILYTHVQLSMRLSGCLLSRC